MTRTLASVALLLLASIAPMAQQREARDKDQPSISLTSNLVLLNLTVTDADQRYVAGLRQEDFHVLEDDRPQSIAIFGSESLPFAAAILLDVSGSMERMVKIACAAARNFAEKMRGEDVFALYAFADQVAQVQPFGSSPDVDEIVWSIRPEGNTALYDCVYQAMKDLSQRPERRRAILVLSDGADTRSRQSLDTCLRAASDASVTIYTVNLMDKDFAHRSEAMIASGAMKAMAERTGGRYINDPGGARMYQAFEEIVEELSHQYTIGYFPTPERQDGKWHKIRVEVSKPNVQIRTRQGYQAPKKKALPFSPGKW
ncbi:MAG: VWA domain-containing protein, partial [Acidobacteria bacterium]|nr:VWA domain-containing protein [Acidobacteriota bacterium]